METSSSRASADEPLSLDSVRKSLIRQEDSIVFALIERARFPSNPRAYSVQQSGGRSLLELFVRDAEALYSKGGRYQNPEEIPFFPDDLPAPLLPPYNFPKVLYPASASVCVNKDIWDFYINDFLPLITSKGDDGNYAATVAADLVCLQALSRRIHYGKYVAEVKFREAPQEYSPLIRIKDKESLMKLLTYEQVEEMVKRRVEKKARVFGQNVTLELKGSNCNEHVSYKVDPPLVSRLYAEWVIPLTRLVEISGFCSSNWVYIPLHWMFYHQHSSNAFSCLRQEKLSSLLASCSSKQISFFPTYRMGF